jgi:uncharacterized protein (DUF302 family)
MAMGNEIGFEVRIRAPFGEAVERVVAALKQEGFGVLTRIDVRATLKEKLGEEFRPYVILGACNPPLAHRALTQDPVIGLMLPCNVTVEEDEPGLALARIANPEVMLMVGAFQEAQELVEVAREARARLERVAEALIEE